MVSIDISPDDLDLLSKFVLRLGGYAEGLFDYHDFGFPKDSLKQNINRVTDELRRMRESIRGSTLSLRPPGLPDDAMWEEADELWNYGQTLRFAAGATMISQRYQSRMTSENLRRAMIAKVLHHCQAGLLDDLIDTGHYTFIEAKDLYHHCLGSMIDPGFDINTFRRELALSLNQEQLSMFDLMTNITAAFNRLFFESPNGQDLFYELQRVDDRLTLGQALTMFQKHPTMDLSKLKRIATSLNAPDSDLKWHERISQALSGATYYNLIDMCFLSEPVNPQELQGTVNAWYYYDLVITRLNHFVGVHKDLRSGIANLALIAMRENELVSMPSLAGLRGALRAHRGILPPGPVARDAGARGHLPLLSVRHDHDPRRDDGGVDREPRQHDPLLPALDLAVHPGLRPGARGRPRDARRKGRGPDRVTPSVSFSRRGFLLTQPLYNEGP